MTRFRAIVSVGDSQKIESMATTHMINVEIETRIAKSKRLLENTKRLLASIGPLLDQVLKMTTPHSHIRNRMHSMKLRQPIRVPRRRKPRTR